MSTLSQENRIAQLSTPLGKDVLCLMQFTVAEGLGELFQIEIDAVSEGDPDTINFDDALGKSCTIKLQAYQGKIRYFNGTLTRAQWVEKIDDYFHYRLVLRPWFHLLDYRADCRIFLDMDVKAIIREVFTKAGFTDFEFITGDYDNIPYCVQYRETDYAFCSRLMEQYGIYYFFKHSDGKHVMVLADSRSSHKTNPDVPSLPYIPLSSDQAYSAQLLGAWTMERRFRTGKVELNDYDYLEPNKNLRASNEAHERYAHSKFEVYDYPGKHDEEDKGKKFSKYRLEAEQSFDHRRYVDGDAPSLFSGTLVSVERHPIGSENCEFLVVRASHRFGVQWYRSGHEGQDESYHGSYEFLPSDQPFRMLQLTPKPRIHGIQTAKVVGKKGEENEEISTDENAHIWVQFYWDREPKKSCPVRISHSWSGKKWGTQFIPRVGMEVVVEFLEGDPDRPLVIGCVYNGDNKVPYDLPGQKTQSGTKSDSSKAGQGGYNEWQFEDQKDHEKITLHAEKDYQLVIKHAETRTIGETFESGTSRDTTLKNGDDKLDVQNGSQHVTISKDQTIEVQNNQTIEVQNNQTIEVQNKIEVTANTSIELKVGASKIRLDQSGITIDAPTVTIKSLAAMTINGTPISIN